MNVEKMSILYDIECYVLSRNVSVLFAIKRDSLCNIMLKKLLSPSCRERYSSNLEKIIIKNLLINLT